MNTRLVYLTPETPAENMEIFAGFSQEDIEHMFYDGGITDFGSFNYMLDVPDFHWWGMYDGHEPIGICYSTDHGPDCCLFHYGIHAPKRGIRALKICREVLQQLPVLRPDLYDGTTMTGITPDTYPHAVKMAKLCGFKYVGIVPNLLYSVYEEISMGAVFTYFIGGNDGKSNQAIQESPS